MSGVFLTGLYLVGGITVTRLPGLLWAALFLTNLAVGFAFIQFTRRFNLVAHERRSWGLSGMALELATAPIYLAAAAAQLAGRPLAYVVTAKGSAATGDTWRTFRPHLGWAVLSVAFITAGAALHHTFLSLYLWALLTIVTCLAPVTHLALSRRSRIQPVTARRRVGQMLLAAGLLTDRPDAAGRRPADRVPARRPPRPAGHHRGTVATLRRPGRRGRLRDGGPTGRDNRDDIAHTAQRPDPAGRMTRRRTHVDSPRYIPS